jgi:alpha-galactosidase
VLLAEDSCYATQDHGKAFAQYALMRDALNATGRPILFSLCGWYNWYAPEGNVLGNVWRMSGDVSSFLDVLRATDDNAPLAEYAGPGGFNDPDILIGSSPGSTLSIPQPQSRTQFNLWCVMAAPLLIGTNLLDISAFDIQVF